MDLLQRIKKQYNLSNLTLGRHTVRADEGTKRIRLWDDERLLEWHFAWREACNFNPYITTDRMLRTKKLENAIKDGKGWITLHDEVTTLSAMKEEEHRWGSLIGQMISFGIETTSEDLTYDTYAIPDKIAKLQAEKLFHASINEKQKQLLLVSQKEAANRLEKAKAIQGYCKDDYLPLLDDLNLNCGKQISGIFFWQGTDKVPERGYYRLHQFLLEWYERNGEDSFLTLVDEIFKVIEPIEQQCYQILSHMLVPYEYINLIEKLKISRTTIETERYFNIFQKQWDVRRKVVIAFSQWLDRQRKKVAR